MEKEQKALEFIMSSLKVDMCPPNQLGIPIAIEDKIFYLSSAVSILNELIESLKKNKEEYDMY
jgi:hypothetical protein